MPEAIRSLLRAHGGLYDSQVRREKKAVGSPTSRERFEQVDSDRRPPRRGDNLAITPRCAEPLPRRVASIPSKTHLPVTLANLPQTMANKQWEALDQALRAADLLLQGGGFSAIVLDLGGVPPELAWRNPFGNLVPLSRRMRTNPRKPPTAYAAPMRAQ